MRITFNPDGSATVDKGDSHWEIDKSQIEQHRSMLAEFGAPQDALLLVDAIVKIYRSENSGAIVDFMKNSNSGPLVFETIAAPDPIKAQPGLLARLWPF